MYPVCVIYISCGDQQVGTECGHSPPPETGTASPVISSRSAQASGVLLTSLLAGETVWKAAAGEGSGEP